MSRRTDKSVQPSNRLDCDIAIVELSAGLLDGVRDRLRGVQRIEGEHLVSERGNWHDSKVLIASFVSTESYISAFKALVSTHHPKQVLFIGEGSCLPESYPKLPLVCGSESIDTNGNRLPLRISLSQSLAIKTMPSAIVGNGPIYSEAVNNQEMIVTTTWLSKVLEAQEESGIESTLLVATNSQSLTKEGVLYPHPNNTPKFTRQLGRLWGKIRSQPKKIVETLKEPTYRWQRQRQIADQIESFMDELD